MHDKLEEIITLLNSLKISQKSTDWIEDLPSEIYDKYFDDIVDIRDSGLNIDKHRWYEYATCVFELPEQVSDKYIGVRHINDLFSESMTCDDVEHTLVFFEMVPVRTTTYVQR